jgi:hypothetical protein
MHSKPLSPVAVVTQFLFILQSTSWALLRTHVALIRRSFVSLSGQFAPPYHAFDATPWENRC